MGPTAACAMGYAVLFWISVLWFGVHEPDWMMSYMIPASELNFYVVQAVFLIALTLSALAGHTLTATCLQRKKSVGAGLIFLGGLTVWAGLWFLTLDRYLTVGTYSQFISGNSVPMQSSSIIGAMNTAGIVQGLAGFGLLAWIYTSGRRLRAR